ncbi:MAG: ribosomal small subunit methyltransferase [Bacteroidota bacterium]
MNHTLIYQYFTDLSDLQQNQIQQLAHLYSDWNERINVVSRKDVEELYERHVLHSMSIGLYTDFLPGSHVVDVGTGGGFPGIPLAILFPEVQFTLVDSIGKKLKVVNEVVEALALKNVRTIHDRIEQVPEKFDFIVSRAVAAMPTFVHWVGQSIKEVHRHPHANGIWYLKGGDLTEELAPFEKRVKVYALHERIPLPFFETKKLVYLPL